MIANNLASAMAVHPGEIIRDEIEFRGIAQRELARNIGVSPTIINEVLKGKRQLGTERFFFPKEVVISKTDAYNRLR